MKVKIGPYLSYFGPHQLAEKLMFWIPNDKDDLVYKFGLWISNTWIGSFLNWVHNKRTRKVEIHIDKWDTWSMDHTLAYIILPMLKQLRGSKFGAPLVDNEDVPPEYHNKNTSLDGDTVDAHFLNRWEYVLGEMIFAFESILNDWEMNYSNHETEEFRQFYNRVQNGFMLFGKYYQSLWD